MRVTEDDVNRVDDQTDITATVYRLYDHWFHEEFVCQYKVCDLLVRDLANALIEAGLVGPPPSKEKA